MPPHIPKPVVHLELHTGDLEGARGFYSDMCGWVPECVAAGCGCYLALDLGGRLGGGLVSCPTDRPVWLPYVAVADVTSATEGARACGARVLLEPREGPAGWRSVVASPGAGEIAFWQPKGTD